MKTKKTVAIVSVIALIFALLVSVAACNSFGNEQPSETECTEHKYGKWETTEEATCTLEGSKQRVCKTCKHKEKAVIEALGHNYAEEFTVDKAPTCTEKGSKSKHCTLCDEKIGVTEINALGHNFVNKICTRCGVELQPTVGLEYTLKGYGESYSVTGIGTATDTDIVIGSTYEGKPVTSIGGSAFEDCKSITSVVIPDSVTSISEDAFYNCTSLTSVVIPDSVTSIGDWAFPGCYHLVEVYNKSSLNIVKGRSDYGYIGYYAKNVYTEEGGSKLTTDENGYIIYTDGEEKSLIGYTGKETELTLPEGITQINQGAFFICTSITSVTIPDSVTSIGERAFSDCTSLTNVTIPDSVTSIGNFAFYDCSSLKAVYIEDIETWCKISFREDTANPLCYAHNLYLNGELVTELIIPDSVTSIGGRAFEYCRSLTSVEIPDSVTSIGLGAFYKCYKLVEVYNKSSLNIVKGSSNYEYIGYYAKNVYTEEGGSKLTTDENGYIIYTDGEEKSLIGYTGKETELILPEGITEIYQYAFYNCTSLTSVTIPDSVTGIGGSAFYNCTFLRSVTIPDSVTGIGDYAFEDCSSLTNVVIPDSVTSIGSGAFSGCYKLVEVYNKSSLNIVKGSSNYGYIGYYAKEIYTEEYTSKLTTDENGYIIYTDGEEKSLIGYTGEETELTLPEGITKIYQYAFYYCTSLTSVTIPDNVTSIGSYAFNWCTSLTSVVIPDSVTSIGSSAFEGCYSLNYNVKDNVKYLGNESNLYLVAIGMVDRTATSLVIEDSCKVISNYAFSGCSSLTSVLIPDNVTSIAGYAFSGCSGLTTINWNATACITAGSSSYPIFNGCMNLTEVNIGSNVTTIPLYAFYKCSGLKRVTIPDRASIDDLHPIEFI